MSEDGSYDWFSMGVYQDLQYEEAELDSGESRTSSPVNG